MNELGCLSYTQQCLRAIPKGAQGIPLWLWAANQSQRVRALTLVLSLQPH